MRTYDELWLVFDKRRYRYIGPGFGAQLESFEWRAPAAGTERELGGVKFRIFSTEPWWAKFRCVWGIAVSHNQDAWDERWKYFKEVGGLR